MNNTEICETLFDAFAHGDQRRIRSLCSADLQAWQNNNPPMSLDRLLSLSKSVLKVVKNFRYEDARRSVTNTGFVQEHKVRGSLPHGSTLDIAVCVIGEVRDGKVYELHEYLDTADASGLVAALG